MGFGFFFVLRVRWVNGLGDLATYWGLVVVGFAMENPD